MDLYSAANIIFPCITLGVMLFTPGVSKHLDRVLVAILCASIAADTLGWFINSMQLPNYFIYNLYIPVIFILQHYLFFKLRQLGTKVFYLSSLTLIFTWLFEVISLHGVNHNLIFFTYVLGALILLINVYGYIMYILNSADVVKIEQSRYFWISIGILLFYIPFLPVFMGVKYSLIHPLLFRGIVVFLQVLLHTSFIIGIRWGNRI